MSLVTRCTHCDTLFKVVADQLKISDGWVRCGQCETIFDAQANLQQAPVRQAPAHVAVVLKSSVVSGSAAPKEADMPLLEPASAIEQLHEDTVPSEFFSNSQAAKRLQELSVQASESEQTAKITPFITPEKIAAPAYFSLENSSKLIQKPEFSSIQHQFSAAKSEFEPQEPVLEPVFDAPIEAVAPPLSVAPAAAPSPASETSTEPEFVRQAQRAARWRSPWMRAFLFLLSLGLLAALVLQIAWKEHDMIAAMQPSLRSSLQAMCQKLGCKIEPLKQIESVFVENSSFNTLPTRSGNLQSYRLTVNLKNKGSLAVALPHVELTLQDRQEQPVLRRVLSPADLGAAQIALQPSAEFSGSVTLQINRTQIEGGSISGYRVWAFYP